MLGGIKYISCMPRRFTVLRTTFDNRSIGNGALETPRFFLVGNSSLPLIKSISLAIRLRHTIYAEPGGLSPELHPSCKINPTAPSSLR